MKAIRQETRSKRPYNSPRLTEYGSVAAMTRQRARSQTADKGGNHMRS